MTTLDTVRALIAAELGLPHAPADDATLEALGADSLDRVQLGISIEKAFGLGETDLVNAAEFDTAAKIAAYLEGLPKTLSEVMKQIEQEYPELIANTPPPTIAMTAEIRMDEIRMGDGRVVNMGRENKSTFDRAWWEHRQADALGYETNGARSLELTRDMEVVAVPVDVFDTINGFLAALDLGRNHRALDAVRRFAALRPLP